MVERTNSTFPESQVFQKYANQIISGMHKCMPEILAHIGQTGQFGGKNALFLERRDENPKLIGLSNGQKAVGSIKRAERSYQQ